VGEEIGILNAKVVTSIVARPKYHSLCSLQTPRYLEYAIETKVFANPTKMLVANIVGRTAKI
jgi:hypothetical protein